MAGLIFVAGALFWGGVVFVALSRRLTEGTSDPLPAPIAALAGMTPGARWAVAGAAALFCATFILRTVARIDAQAGIIGPNWMVAALLAMLAGGALAAARAESPAP